jgi:hypothetical protein
MGDPKRDDASGTAPSLSAGADDVDALQSLVADYVRGRLTGDALDAFELRMMDDRRLQEMVDIELRLQQAVRAMGEHSAGAVWPRPHRRQRRVALAAAAAVVLGVGFVAGRYAGSAGQGAAAADLVLLDTLRGAPSAPSASVEVSQALLVVEIPVATTEARSLRISPLHAGGAAVTFDAVTPDADGVLRVVVPGRSFEAGVWCADIGAGADGDRRCFEVRR